MIKTSYTKKCHNSFGNSSQTVVDSLIWVSGIMGIDPSDNQLVKGGTDAEIKMLIKNMSECLSHAFTSWSNILKLQIYLTDINDFEKVDAALKEVLGETKPIYTVMEVSKLLSGANVCIDAVAAAF